AGGLARSTTLGLIALTPRPVRLTAGERSPAPDVKVVVAAAIPCSSEERRAGNGVMEKGTVSVVVPGSVVARTCASIVEPRMKFTTGSPKPRSASPSPVMVKLAGGLARSTTLGLIALTPRPVPLTAGETSPPFEVKVIFAATIPSTVGLNRTTTI